MGEIVVLFIAVLCAAVFWGIGICALKRSEPMHFWSGSHVPVEQIQDVKAYNKANAKMWFVYGLLYALAGVNSILGNGRVGVVLLAGSCFPGLFVLMWVYSRILKKYKRRP